VRRSRKVIIALVILILAVVVIGFCGQWIWHQLLALHGSR
jgi:hypothetical protein